jgi:hypothetical protein
MAKALLMSSAGLGNFVSILFKKMDYLDQEYGIGKPVRFCLSYRRLAAPHQIIHVNLL